MLELSSSRLGPAWKLTHGRTSEDDVNLITSTRHITNAINKRVQCCFCQHIPVDQVGQLRQAASDDGRKEAAQGVLGLPVERALACVEYEHDQVLSGVNYLIAVFGPMHANTGDAGKIDVEYEDPVNEESLYLSRIVRHSLVAELVAAQTRRLFVLPNDIAIVFTECLGEETAFWRNDRKEIIFCYDLLERFRYLYQAKVCLEGAGSNEAARRACFAR